MSRGLSPPPLAPPVIVGIYYNVYEIQCHMLLYVNMTNFFQMTLLMNKQTNSFIGHNLMFSCQQLAVKYCHG